MGSSALLPDLDQDLGLILDLGQDEDAFLQSRINRFQVCCSLLQFRPNNLDCRSTAKLHTQTLRNRLGHKQSLNAYDEAGQGQSIENLSHLVEIARMGLPHTLLHFLASLAVKVSVRGANLNEISNQS